MPERGDAMALAIFGSRRWRWTGLLHPRQFTDPDTYFVGGGVIEAAPHFRDWFLATVKEHTESISRQAEIAEIHWCRPGHGRRARSAIAGRVGEAACNHAQERACRLTWADSTPPFRNAYGLYCSYR